MEFFLQWFCQLSMFLKEFWVLESGTEQNVEEGDVLDGSKILLGVVKERSLDKIFEWNFLGLKNMEQWKIFKRTYFKLERIWDSTLQIGVQNGCRPK